MNKNPYRMIAKEIHKELPAGVKGRNVSKTQKEIKEMVEKYNIPLDEATDSISRQLKRAVKTQN